MLYVDDVVLATNSVEYKSSLFTTTNEKYGYKDGGTLHHCLGIHVEQNDEGVYIHRSKYCNEVLERFELSEAHGSATPMETNARYSKFTEESHGDGSKDTFDYRQAIESLMYLAVCTRPDISFAVGTLSRFMSNPTRNHCGAVSRVMKYLASTRNMGIMCAQVK